MNSAEMNLTASTVRVGNLGGLGAAGTVHDLVSLLVGYVFILSVGSDIGNFKMWLKRTSYVTGL